MKEDLGLYGNQLNYMQTCWTVGYVIGEIPSNLLLTRVRPRYWIPAAEVCHLFYLAAIALTLRSFFGLFSRSPCRGATPPHNSTFCAFSLVGSSPQM